ncbi:hypothetical protein [Lactococcus lactis]|uniref:hypothetical protein n=1 Tax=Lactococcus lactis TaxID=1358 RepID=UPI003FD6A2A7
MSELEEFKKVVSPIAYGLAYKSELGTTEYQQLYAEEDVIKYFNNKPQLTIPKSIADEIDKFAHTNWANWQFYFYSDEMSKELIDWFDNGDSEFTNSKIAMVYLNPLTRDLVKVGKG